MRRAYFSTIKHLNELRDELNAMSLEDIAIYDDLGDPFADCDNKLPALTPEQLEEWKFTGLTNWAILEMIYGQETETNGTI